jgi:hypothetical protein
MKLTDIITENGKSSERVKARKSKVQIFNTIKDALTSGMGPGTKFSTKRAGRLYVSTEAGWGKKSKGLVAKGFTPGSSTPSSSWRSIVGYAQRTKIKHAGKRDKRIEGLYGAGRKISDTTKNRRRMGRRA